MPELKTNCSSKSQDDTGQTTDAQFQEDHLPPLTNPGSSPLEALAHCRSQPLDTSPASSSDADLWNKANFPFYQPCFLSISL